MKLWLLKALDDWDPWYDTCEGFVVRAETEEHTREIAQQHEGCENPQYSHHLLTDIRGSSPWLDPSKTSCVELVAEGKPGLVLRDFHQA
jgi:hypothetical protein